MGKQKWDEEEERVELCGKEKDEEKEKEKERETKLEKRELSVEEHLDGLIDVEIEMDDDEEIEIDESEESRTIQIKVRENERESRHDRDTKERDGSLVVNGQGDGDRDGTNYGIEMPTLIIDVDGDRDREEATLFKGSSLGSMSIMAPPLHQANLTASTFVQVGLGPLSEELPYESKAIEGKIKYNQLSGGGVGNFNIA